MNEDDENKYNEFVNSVAEFTVTCMTLWQNQHQINGSFHEQIAEHLSALTTTKDLMKGLRDVCLAHKTLLLEHESRILALERALAKDKILENASCLKPN